VGGGRALAHEGWGSSVEWPLGVSYISQLYLRGLLSTGSPGRVAADSPGPERPHSEMPTYVNIPISPISRPQLHYMDLELPGASAGVRGELQPGTSGGSCDLSTGPEPQVHPQIL
jgi:hypothetical protein